MMPFLFLVIGAWIFMAIGQGLIYFYAPLEESMGFVQKIFYLHLPLAIWALFSFFMVFIFSILYLVKKNPSFDHWSRAFAETGLLYATLALLTGMIWGRVSWGVWWTWDPRLTTTLVLWFVYAGYLLIGNMNLSLGVQASIRAVIGIIAFVDVPLVFLSARIFRSIHPAVFASSEGALETEMKLTVYCCIAAMGLFCVALSIFRKGQLSLLERAQNYLTMRILKN